MKKVSTKPIAKLKSSAYKPAGRMMMSSEHKKGFVFGTPYTQSSAGLKKMVGAKVFNSYPKYKKGGKVNKTGPAIVHKGERVLTAKQAKKFEKHRKSYFGL